MEIYTVYVYPRFTCLTQQSLSTVVFISYISCCVLMLYVFYLYVCVLWFCVHCFFKLILLNFVYYVHKCNMHRNWILVLLDTNHSLPITDKRRSNLVFRTLTLTLYLSFSVSLSWSRSTESPSIQGHRDFHPHTDDQQHTGRPQLAHQLRPVDAVPSVPQLSAQR